MNTDQGVKADERTLAVARAANSWGLNVITFALLVDIIWAQLASRSLQTVFLAGFATFERQQTALSSRTSSSRLDVALSASDF